MSDTIIIIVFVAIAVACWRELTREGRSLAESANCRLRLVVRRISIVVAIGLGALLVPTILHHLGIARIHTIGNNKPVVDDSMMARVYIGFLALGLSCLGVSAFAFGRLKAGRISETQSGGAFSHWKPGIWMGIASACLLLVSTFSFYARPYSSQNLNVFTDGWGLLAGWVLIGLWYVFRYRPVLVGGTSQVLTGNGETARDP